MPGEPAPPAAPAHAAGRRANPPILARSQPSVWPWPLNCPFLRWVGFGRPFASPGVLLPSPFADRPRLSPYLCSFSVNSSAPLLPVSPLSLRALLTLLLPGPVTSPPVSHPHPCPSWRFLSPVFPLLLHRASASSFSATPHPGNLFQPGVPTGSQSFPSTIRPAECVGPHTASGTMSAPPSPWRDSEAPTSAAFSSPPLREGRKRPGSPSL